MDSYSDLLKLTNETENSYWYKKSVPENTTLLYEGEVADKIYFIKKGALRLWNNDDGKDITFQFFFEGQIVASYESFHLGKPSIFTIETIENTDLLVLEKRKLEHLLAYTEYFLSRIKESPEKRYISLLEKRPELVRRVPDHYIASFLGITPVSLSRIKKRIKS